MIGFICGGVLLVEIVDFPWYVNVYVMLSMDARPCGPLVVVKLCFIAVYIILLPE